MKWKNHRHCGIPSLHISISSNSILNSLRVKLYWLGIFDLISPTATLYLVYVLFFFNLLTFILCLPPRDSFSLLLFLPLHVLTHIYLLIPFLPLFVKFLLLQSLLLPLLVSHFDTLLCDTGLTVGRALGVVLHLLPHVLLLLTLLKAKVLFLRLKPPGLLLGFKFLEVFLLLILLGFTVDFLTDSLEFSFSFHTLSCTVRRVVWGTRRRRNVVSNIIIVAFFRIWVLKHLISLFDLNEPLIELSLLVYLS